MAIHHDKLAYGKISSLREDFSEDRLIAMADRLSEGRKDPFPDYDRSIAGLACSLLRHFGVSLPQGEGALPLADTCLADEYESVAVLLLDGMGMCALNRNLAKGGFFRSHLVGEYSSVFPSSTVAATTSFLSGASPCRHGWLGWTGYFPEVDRNVVLFSNEDAMSGRTAAREPLAPHRFSYRSILALISAQGVSTHMIAPFLPPNPKNFEELCSIMRDILSKNGRKMIYAYWPEPDAAMHCNGVFSEEAESVMAALERETQALWESVPKNTLLLITADHGQIDAGKNYCICNFPAIADCLKRQPSCEPRALNLFVKEGKQEAFRSAFEEYFQDKFKLLSKEEFLRSGLLGRGAPHPALSDTLGDFFAVATGDAAIYNTKEEAERFKGVHAGLTEDELCIPLIVLRR